MLRRPIVRAKAEQGWYEGARVRVAASITPDDRPVRPVWAVHLLAIGLGVASAAATAVAYPGLPDPLPAHYNALGEVDRWEPKTWVSALTLPALAVAFGIALAVQCWFLARRSDPHLPDGHPTVAREAERRNARIMQVALAWLSVGTVAIFAFLALAPLVRLSPVALNAAIWAGLMAAMVPVFWMMARAARVRKEALAAPGASGPESPDDDRYWKGGVFYYNPADPRFTVPRRTGVGLDLNLGHPGGQAVAWVALAVLVAVCVLPFLLPA